MCVVSFSTPSPSRKKEHHVFRFVTTTSTEPHDWNGLGKIFLGFSGQSLAIREWVSTVGAMRKVLRLLLRRVKGNIVGNRVVTDTSTGRRAVEPLLPVLGMVVVSKTAVRMTEE